MLQLRVVCPPDRTGSVYDALVAESGAVALSVSTSSSGAVITADVARECADDLLDRLRELGVLDDGMVTMAPLDTAVGELARRAEADAPGEGADALIWDDLEARTGEDSVITWTFTAFMVLATLLAAIGIVTDSQVTIVGAMVVGPEFGPLAAIAVGLVKRRPMMIRRATAAVVLGFVVALAVTAALSLLGRVAGLFDVGDVTGRAQTEFIYQPGWFSLITALVAGAAGMLSLTSSKSAALVGVFISVTTVPAAGNVAVAGTVGDWHQAGESLLQLAINLVGIVAAGVGTLLLLERVQASRGELRTGSGA
ncbi:DUF389 domain-containing protein [Jatrophihabitans endophyticus]